MSSDLENYVPPSLGAEAFNCPYLRCRTFAEQFWYSTVANDDSLRWMASALKSTMDLGPLAIDREDLDAFQESDLIDYPVNSLWLSECRRCRGIAIWIRDEMVYPQHGGGLPPANPDLPSHISEIYDEAASILNRSPRGAAGLLRLAIQVLCKELGLPGEKINADIGALVARGLDARVQQALDSVRVIGNNALHPGEIDIKDDRATAVSLLRLVNFIADRTISAEKHVEAACTAGLSLSHCSRSSRASSCASRFST